MASANVHEFTESNFQQEVINSQVPVLVDFWAEWCQPCRLLSPTIDAVAASTAGKAKVGKIDTDSNQRLAMQYNVTAIPTVMIFKNGQVVRKFVGLAKQADLAAALNDAAAQ
jgi:thioredoxin 1